MAKPVTRLADCTPVEMVPGIFRTTLAYIDEGMLCHFKLSKGSEIPLHNHPAIQIGYLISGKVKFILKEDGESEHSFIAEPGTSSAFSPNEYHGAARAARTCEVGRSQTTIAPRQKAMM